MSFSAKPSPVSKPSHSPEGKRKTAFNLPELGKSFHENGPATTDAVKPRIKKSLTRAVGAVDDDSRTPKGSSPPRSPSKGHIGLGSAGAARGSSHRVSSGLNVVADLEKVRAVTWSQEIQNSATKCATHIDEFEHFISDMEKMKVFRYKGTQMSEYIRLQREVSAALHSLKRLAGAENSTGGRSPDSASSPSSPNRTASLLVRSLVNRFKDLIARSKCHWDSSTRTLYSAMYRDEGVRNQLPISSILQRRKQGGGKESQGDTFWTAVIADLGAMQYEHLADSGSAEELDDLCEYDESIDFDSRTPVSEGASPAAPMTGENTMKSRKSNRSFGQKSKDGLSDDDFGSESDSSSVDPFNSPRLKEMMEKLGDHGEDGGARNSGSDDAVPNLSSFANRLQEMVSEKEEAIERLQEQLDHERTRADDVTKRGTTVEKELRAHLSRLREQLSEQTALLRRLTRGSVYLPPPSGSAEVIKALRAPPGDSMLPASALPAWGPSNAAMPRRLMRFALCNAEPPSSSASVPARGKDTLTKYPSEVGPFVLDQELDVNNNATKDSNARKAAAQWVVNGAGVPVRAPAAAAHFARERAELLAVPSLRRPTMGSGGSVRTSPRVLKDNSSISHSVTSPLARGPSAASPSKGGVVPPLNLAVLKKGAGPSFNTTPKAADADKDRVAPLQLPTAGDIERDCEQILSAAENTRRVSELNLVSLALQQELKRAEALSLLEAEKGDQRALRLQAKRRQSIQQGITAAFQSASKIVGASGDRPRRRSSVLSSIPDSEQVSAARMITVSGSQLDTEGEGISKVDAALHDKVIKLQTDLAASRAQMDALLKLHSSAVSELNELRNRSTAEGKQVSYRHFHTHSHSTQIVPVPPHAPATLAASLPSPRSVHGGFGGPPAPLSACVSAVPSPLNSQRGGILVSPRNILCPPVPRNSPRSPEAISSSHIQSQPALPVSGRTRPSAACCGATGEDAGPINPTGVRHPHPNLTRSLPTRGHLLAASTPEGGLISSPSRVDTVVPGPSLQVAAGQPPPSALTLTPSVISIPLPHPIRFNPPPRETIPLPPLLHSVNTSVTQEIPHSPVARALNAQERENAMQRNKEAEAEAKPAPLKPLSEISVDSSGQRERERAAAKRAQGKTSAGATATSAPPYNKSGSLGVSTGSKPRPPRPIVSGRSGTLGLSSQGTRSKLNASFEDKIHAQARVVTHWDGKLRTKASTTRLGGGGSSSSLKNKGSSASLKPKKTTTPVKKPTAAKSTLPKPKTPAAPSNSPISPLKVAKRPAVSPKAPKPVINVIKTHSDQHLGGSQGPSGEPRIHTTRQPATMRNQDTNLLSLPKKKGALKKRTAASTSQKPKSSVILEPPEVVDPPVSHQAAAAASSRSVSRAAAHLTSRGQPENMGVPKEARRAVPGATKPSNARTAGTARASAAGPTSKLQDIAPVSLSAPTPAANKAGAPRGPSGASSRAPPAKERGETDDVKRRQTGATGSAGAAPKAVEKNLRRLIAKNAEVIARNLENCSRPDLGGEGGAGMGSLQQAAVGAAAVCSRPRLIPPGASPFSNQGRTPPPTPTPRLGVPLCPPVSMQATSIVGSPDR
uniref:Uncharacterized protein n=1 Tax=Chromera velia CCMP2878 TaxID=1169474 RepID=A0A0G4IF61_9ALVE|eukprot:Cvel_13881.t1-p1 / transcript=Cvel_13881.t1 / gene=Cvel_13881 / organism=Chromera_velia_CCMP2878 / gene_product=hypothetical protein / transcript_product=hypothetical protein / location=Cvel_scaffold966:26988-34443(+) / protein_length=1591 / sequence_SO=supercontig / SO=protein_coding / is_pseudo=false